MRVGIGIDTHKLMDGSYLLLAGVKISSDKSIKAHSDGDIVFHSLADAIYGAVALGDIGQHFPDSDNSNKDIDSSIILSHSLNSAKEKGFIINNIDIVILLQSPKIAKYSLDMIKNISRLLECNVDCVNIKATTGEGLGFIGKQEGVTCHSIVSLKSSHLE